MGRALHQQGMLELFCTDFWNRWDFLEGLNRLCQCKTLAKIAGNFHPDLPPDKVRSFNGLGLKARLTYRLSRRKSTSIVFRNFIRYGQAFCKAVNKLPQNSHNVFIGFSYASLESLQHEKDLGNLAIVNQFEPGRREFSLITEERNRWPGWDLRQGSVPEEYWQRLEAEWHIADVILVNSNFSRSTLVEQGVPSEKIQVIPLPLPDDEIIPVNQERGFHDGVLKVLWLSSVRLRKGIPYLIEAAKLLKKEPVQFTVAGGILLSDKALKTAPANMKFLGEVSRSAVARLYAESHVFVLPSISEGFARVQLEAMAAGLPVITTPNCGEVVTHGEDGFIVPIRDPEALAAAIQKFLDQPGLTKVMSANASAKVKRFSLEAYGKRLRDIIETASS